VSGEALVEKKYLKKNTACFACPIGCGRVITLPNGIDSEGLNTKQLAYGADCV